MKKIILLFSFLLFISCDNSVKMNALQYKEGKGEDLFVYKEGKPYNGIAWSDDGKSYCISVDCGILKEYKIFIPDGILFYSYKNGEKYYNENGNEISMYQARELYPENFELKNQLLYDLNEVIDNNIIRE